MTNKTAEPGDTVELKDKEGGFTDPDTGFDISRDQKKELGDSIGKRTQMAIQSGGLLIVSGKSGKAKSSDPQTQTAGNTESDLPEGFPGRDPFIAAGMNLEAVKSFDFETGKVAGVGAGTIKALNEYWKINEK